MKSFLLAVLLALSLPAFATNKTKPEPPKQNPPSATSSAQASAGAAAYGQGGSSLQGQRQGQQMGQSLSSTNGLSVNDNGISSSRNNLWVFPAPVFTPPMAPVPCPSANIENMAVAGGWNFFSYAKGTTNTDNCTAILMRNAFIEQCKYASAKEIEDLLSQKVLPAFKPSKIEYTDLTRSECESAKRLATTPTVVNNYHTFNYLNEAAKPILKKKRKVLSCPLPASKVEKQCKPMT